jgi:hypothetical protein
MPEKCFWCSEETSDPQEIKFYNRGKFKRGIVCSTVCEKALRDFVTFADKHTKHYILGLTFSVIIGLIITIWRIKVDFGALGVLIIFAGSGLTLIKYPFVTPRTVASLGAKKAIATGRFIGWLNIIIGIVFWIILAVYLS